MRAVAQLWHNTRMNKPHIVKFRVTDKEFAALTIIAEELGHTVSQVVRDKLFAPDAQRPALATGAGQVKRSRRSTGESPNTTEIVRHIAPQGRMVDVRAPLPAPGKCGHGKKQGEVCYKCDPRFGYPSLRDALQV